MARPLAPRRLAVLALAGGCLLAGCSSAPPPLAASAILSSSPSTHTVELTLDAAESSADSGFNFDGYGTGAMQVSVPVGWTVAVTCRNDATQFTHSCAIVDDVAPSTSGAPLAFPGAESAQPTTGLPPGGVSTFRFLASRVGRYRIACLVTGHELDGMWDRFDVTAAGRPGVRLRR